MDSSPVPKTSVFRIKVVKASLTIALLVTMGLAIVHAFENNYFKYKISAIERIVPESFNILFVWEAQGSVGRPDQVIPYINFYEQIVKYFPEQTDAWNMLGLCYYWAGQDVRAIQSLQKAISIDPHFFWSNYNVGMLSYQNGQLAEAIPYFENAIKTNPDQNLRFVQDSRVVYRSLLNEIPELGNELRGRMIRGYQQAYEMLILISYRLQDFPAMLNYAESALISKIGKENQFHYLAGLAKSLEAAKQKQDFQESNQRSEARMLKDPFLAEISNRNTHLALF
jgi:tetratricopeptide (TPR) repeat protein